MNYSNCSALVFAFTLLPTVAAAQQSFATPPDAALAVNEYAADPQPFPMPARRSSLVRLYVGPALRVSQPATDGGLFTAVDWGNGATGFRASGAWLHAGGEHGVSQYSGELWIDFGAERRFHPVVAAGAGLARVGTVSAEERSVTANIGIGSLRGSLDYALPVAGEDARIGVDLVGNVPAIRGSDARDVGPWLIAVARVGIGF